MLFMSSSKKVLIIDDDRSLLRQLRVRLEKREKVEVITCDCGKQGLEQALEHDFDLIILDWMLPDIQGIDVLEALKANSVTRDIPVLMLTGRNKIGEVEDAFEQGAEGYLTKPCELQKLGDKVSDMLAA